MVLFAHLTVRPIHLLPSDIYVSVTADLAAFAFVTRSLFAREIRPQCRVGVRNLHANDDARSEFDEPTGQRLTKYLEEGGFFLTCGSFPRETKKRRTISQLLLYSFKPGSSAPPTFPLIKSPELIGRHFPGSTRLIDDVSRFVVLFFCLFNISRRFFLRLWVSGNSRALSLRRIICEIPRSVLLCFYDSCHCAEGTFLTKEKRTPGE